MTKKDIYIFYPRNRKEWREWLEKNHQSEQSIWLKYFKSSTKIASLTWGEAVDEAVCFGWIDSTKKTIDTESFMQYFSKRKATSIWSKVNKDKVSQLIKSGQMTKVGFDSIKIAKENGSWKILDDVEKLVIPNDLEKEFTFSPSSKDYFLRLSISKRKELLAWVILAKRPETRAKRIKDIVECANKKQRPKQFV